MNNTNKFSGKADIYEMGRLGYPQDLIRCLEEKAGLSKESKIADIGSGTGLLTRHLLKKGCVVFGVEPNDDMRSVAEELLQNEKNFISVMGTAEQTTLGRKSVDCITVAQAFHWFEKDAFKKECQRILKPNGTVCLIWNTIDETDKFSMDYYDVCKQYCPEFKGLETGIEKIQSEIKNFYEGSFTVNNFENNLSYNRERFIQRALSGSYSLHVGDSRYAEYISALECIFVKHAGSNEIVVMLNKSSLYMGHVE